MGTVLRSFRIDEAVNLALHAKADRSGVSDSAVLNNVLKKALGVKKLEKAKLGRKPKGEAKAKSKRRTRLTVAKSTGRSGDAALPTERVARRSKRALPASPPSVPAHISAAPAPPALKLRKNCPRCEAKLKDWGPVMKRCDNCAENFTPQQLEI